VPFGATKEIGNIDSLQYEQYQKSDQEVPSSYGIAAASSSQKQELGQLEDQLNLLSSQINDYTTSFSQTNQELNAQSEANVAGLQNSLQTTNYNKYKIEAESNNLNSIENIEKQINLLTLQQNYRYMFWTLITGCIILVLLHFSGIKSASAAATAAAAAASAVAANTATAAQAINSSINNFSTGIHDLSNDFNNDFNKSTNNNFFNTSNDNNSNTRNNNSNNSNNNITSNFFKTNKTNNSLF